MISCTVLLKISRFSQRFIKMVSAPNISGTSVNTAVPPCEIRKSENTPNKGLAVMPEKPSEPEISSEPDTLSEPESEAVKAEEGEKAPQDVTVEEMQTMGVDALRRLARALEIKNMTRAEIRFAKKQELIQKITEFKES